MNVEFFPNFSIQKRVEPGGRRGGQDLILSSITVAPNNGGSAVINDNGTPGDPTDDYIDYTPSIVYLGDETSRSMGLAY